MRIYVGNLSFDVDEDEFKKLFSAYGDIEEATLVKDKFSGRSKGFGFVTFKDSAAAEKAIVEMNGKDVKGRELKVSEARPMEEREERPRRSFDRRRY